MMQSFKIEFAVNQPQAVGFFLRMMESHTLKGPDLLTVNAALDAEFEFLTPDNQTIKQTLKDGKGRFRFSTILAPLADQPGSIGALISGKWLILALGAGDIETVMAAIKERNVAAFPDLVATGGYVPQEEESFRVAGSYTRPAFALSKSRGGQSLLKEFFQPQTPLNWSVGLALFSLTNENQVRDWQETSLKEIKRRVCCLDNIDQETAGLRTREILAEIVRLHKTSNYYLTADHKGKRARLGSYYPIPELELIFFDQKTKKEVVPLASAVRKYAEPLDQIGRLKWKPGDGPRPLMTLPAPRWKLTSVRWRWAASFEDDLTMPGIDSRGRKLKKKGYWINTSIKIFDALATLRKENNRYAARLLVVLSQNINKTEEGIAFDRLARMIGLSDDFDLVNKRKRIDIIAESIDRLKQADIAALLSKSDTRPRQDRNKARRVACYYKLYRSAAFRPLPILSKDQDRPKITTETTVDNEPKQAALFEGIPSIPDGPEIRAAREKAGVNLRDFADLIGGPSFATWSKYEAGKLIDCTRIKPRIWREVRAFVDKYQGEK